MTKEHIHRYVPNEFILNNDGNIKIARSETYSYEPSNNTLIVSTNIGLLQFNVSDAYINGELRMVVIDDSTNETIAKWKRVPPKLTNCYKPKELEHNNKPLFDEYGNYHGPDFPDECIEECSASGDASGAVAYWREELNFVVPREMAIDWLAEYGIERDELNAKSDTELAEYVLFYACADVSDRRFEYEGEENEEPYNWYGLVH